MANAQFGTGQNGSFTQLICDGRQSARHRDLRKNHDIHPLYQCPQMVGHKRVMGSGMASGEFVESAFREPIRDAAIMAQLRRCGADQVSGGRESAGKRGQNADTAG